MPTQVNLGHVVGPTGPTGPAPVKGVDYWTPSDQESIVDAAAQQAVHLINDNIPIGNPTSEVIVVEDAFDSAPRSMAVYGSTRQNLWVNPVTNTLNGVTLTNSGNGSFTISGTATASTTFVTRSYVLRPGSTYTASISAAMNNGACASVYEYNSKNAVVVFHDFGSSSSNLSTTFTVDKSCASTTLNVYVPSGDTVSGTYRVMLNEGDTAEPWCPPGINGVDELSIVTAGKNLLTRMGVDLPYTAAGITFSDNGDSGIRIRGTATGPAYFNFFSLVNSTAPFIPSGTYTASLTGRVTGVNFAVGYFDYEIGGDYTYWLSVSTNEVTKSIDRPVYLRPYLGVSTGTTVDTVVYPQLELGPTATAYEPPAVTTTPVDLDGHSLNSLPDGTRDELKIDESGNVTLLQRVGVATAPTDAENMTFDPNDSKGRARFPLSSTTANLVTATNGMCDKLPMRLSSQSSTFPSYALASEDWGYAKNPAITSAATAAKVAGGATYLYPLATPQEIDLPGVSMPSLHIPDFVAFAASTVPCEMSVEYERDINIILANLEAVQAALLGGE